MKKFILLAACLTVLASGVFALDKTIGGGLMYNAGFTNAKYEEYDDYFGSNDTFEMNIARNGFGLFAFFGVSQYFELNLGLLIKSPSTVEIKYTYDYGGGYKDSGTLKGTADYLDDCVALQLGTYFKYPIPISTALVFFPTVGVDLELTLGGESDYFDWWSDFWIRAGVGLDIFLTERMFLRGHAIYGVAIPFGGEVDNFDSAIGHGLLIKFGIGWML